MMRFPRRQRTTFTQPQLDLLIEAFKTNHYPEANDRNALAKITNLDPSRIQVWFQNQRAKARKRQGHSQQADAGLVHATEQQLREQARLGAPVQSQRAPVTTSMASSKSRVYVFDTKLANEAAQAVAEGRVSSILEYHELICRLTPDHMQILAG